MAENNLNSYDTTEISQSISDENTKEDDEKEAGPSLNNCSKDRGQAISNASRGFGNQVQQQTTVHHPNDTEMDANPMTEKSIPFVGAESIDVKSIPEKNHEQMCQLERDILRPKDHNDQPMTPDHLIDIVIIYAVADYKLANEYKEWLIKIASTESIFDIKVELYTSEYHFPANDVRVVEEVLNKAMRVLMLLSVNFTEEVSLTFIKEETISLTRLQDQDQDMMSLFEISIMNQKKHCVRPVHTAPKKGRNYQVPVGLTSLRAFNYFQPNKESPYEKDGTKAFLKNARDDRKSYTKELQNVAQAMETQMTIPYCNSTSLSNLSDRRDGGKNIDQATLFKPFTSQETSNHISREDHGERGSSDTFDSISNQEVANNQLQTEPVLNSSPPRPSNSKLHVQETNALSVDCGFSREEQEDIEPDGNAGTDSSTSKLLTLENSASGSLIQDSLMSDTNFTALVEFPTKSNHNSNLYDKTEHAMKHKQIDVPNAGEVKENTLSYTGPSGRSGIRTGANPEYRDYMQGVPNSNSNTQWPRSSTDNRNEINSARIQDHHGTLPHYARPSSPVRTSPIFNIQGCATVQICYSNRVIGNQHVEATNLKRPNDDDDIGNRRANVNDNGRPVDEPTTSDSHDYTEEPHMSYGSQGRESLNNLSPISDQEKHKKNFCDDDSSSESYGDDDMSNSYTKQEDRTINSEDVFGNGNSLHENLSSNCSDKYNTEKVIFDDETLQEKSSISEEDDYNKKEVQIDENLQIHRTEDIGNFSSDPSLESSVSSEYTSLSTYLRWESRKNRQCNLQYHYNKQVKCYTTGSKDIHDEDDID